MSVFESRVHYDRYQYCPSYSQLAAPLIEMQTYTPPVSRLLEYTACQSTDPDKWPDYLNEFGFTQEHVPELLTLMQDHIWLAEDVETDPPEAIGKLDPAIAAWAPIHAWRSLGQLKSVEFLDAAIALLKQYEIDWMWEEFPKVLMLIGPSMIESLGAAILTEAPNAQAMPTLSSGLYEIAKAFPNERDRCIALMLDTLRNYEQNQVTSNANLIAHLLDLKISEPATIAVIEAAYHADRVDQFYAGTWPQVQVELGLKTADDFTEAELKAPMPPELAHMHETMGQLQESIAALEQSRKPSAFAKGLPIDYDQRPDTKPFDFQDMQRSTSPPKPTSGFGAKSKSSKKKKKKR